MKKMALVAVLATVLLVASVSAAYAHTDMKSDYSYSSYNGSVRVQGYARARSFTEEKVDGWISSTAQTSSGSNYVAYYIHAGGTLHATFMTGGISKSYAPGMSASGYSDDFVSDSETIQVGAAGSNSCYVTGSHDFKKTSSSSSYSCKTQTANAFHN